MVVWWRACCFVLTAGWCLGLCECIVFVVVIVCWAVGFIAVGCQALVLPDRLWRLLMRRRMHWGAEHDSGGYRPVWLRLVCVGWVGGWSGLVLLCVLRLEVH